MKIIFFGMAIAAVSFTACNGNTTSKTNEQSSNDTASQTKMQTATATNKPASINEIVAAYLQIKNGLSNDNGNNAAAGGKTFVEALGKIDKSSMSATQKKSFEDIADDAKEMAEHIGANAGDIAHQREHFEMLSKDMYDLVKEFGGGQPLYKDFCPMYNNGKGAAWLSETKEIKNPYLGKKMTTCGSVKEEIKL